MKKLYFLLPVISWILTYWLFKYTNSLVMLDNAIGFYWVVTDAISALITLLLFFYAIERNTNW